ncbi:MAG: hypothetical protein Q9173_004202 [Seirophora scorigena]
MAPDSVSQHFPPSAPVGENGDTDTAPRGTSAPEIPRQRRTSRPVFIPDIGKYYQTDFVHHAPLSGPLQPGSPVASGTFSQSELQAIYRPPLHSPLGPLRPQNSEERAAPVETTYGGFAPSFQPSLSPQGPRESEGRAAPVNTTYGNFHPSLQPRGPQDFEERAAPVETTCGEFAPSLQPPLAPQGPQDSEERAAPVEFAYANFAPSLQPPLAPQGPQDSEEGAAPVEIAYANFAPSLQPPLAPPGRNPPSSATPAFQNSVSMESRAPTDEKLSPSSAPRAKGRGRRSSKPTGTLSLAKIRKIRGTANTTARWTKNQMIHNISRQYYDLVSPDTDMWEDPNWDPKWGYLNRHGAVWRDLFGKVKALYSNATAETIMEDVLLLHLDRKNLKTSRVGYEKDRFAE